MLISFASSSLARFKPPFLQIFQAFSRYGFAFWPGCFTFLPKNNPAFLLAKAFLFLGFMTCALVPLWTYLAYFAFRVLPTFTSPAVTSNTLISLLRLPVFMGAVLCRKSSKFCHNPPLILKPKTNQAITLKKMALWPCRILEIHILAPEMER